jgi:hypothetical protein
MSNVRRALTSLAVMARQWPWRTSFIIAALVVLAIGAVRHWDFNGIEGFSTTNYGWLVFSLVGGIGLAWRLARSPGGRRTPLRPLAASTARGDARRRRRLRERDPPGARTAHAAPPSQPAQPLEREGRLSEGPHRESHEHERVVVARDAVQVHGCAAAAAVHERPFAAGANVDRDRLHRRATVGGAVAGTLRVEVPAPQAVRAVVAMVRSRRIHGHVEPAVVTSECVRPSAPDAVALIARQGRPPKSALTRTEDGVARCPG